MYGRMEYLCMLSTTDTTCTYNVTHETAGLEINND